MAEISKFPVDPRDRIRKPRVKRMTSREVMMLNSGELHDLYPQQDGLVLKILNWVLARGFWIVMSIMFLALGALVASALAS